jgi:hypothetical protein
VAKGVKAERRKKNGRETRAGRTWMKAGATKFPYKSEAKYDHNNVL